jgi:eukaryotic-like serine/threonine-protein kinase
MSGHETVGGDRVIAGRYRLTDVIGFGGAGTVWTAIDELLGREVAVKDVVPPWLGNHERALVRERTMREARAACRIDHPNVVEIYDVVEQDGRPWIVMRLVKAPSLARIIEENGPCEPGQAAWIGLQVLGALRAAHKQGITHRDVKPSNVLVDGEHAVLTDFGIATIAGEATLTTPDKLVGAPSYIAPERVRGVVATAASDLWSLGATLYAAVEGRPPHMREGLIALLTAVVIDEPDPPVNAGALGPVLEALLCKEPAQRPNAAQAESLLRHVLRLTDRGHDPAAVDIVDETNDLLLYQQTMSGPWRLVDRHTAIDPWKRVDQNTTSDSLRSLDSPLSQVLVAADSGNGAGHMAVPAGRRRRFRALGGAVTVALLAILLTGMLVRPALLPGSPTYRPPAELGDNPSTTSTIVPAEQPVQVGNGARSDRSVLPSPVQPSPTQSSPAQPSPTQPAPVQPSPTQPAAEPAQPTTQQPEPTATGTPAPAPTTEPPPPTTLEPPGSTAEISESA